MKECRKKMDAFQEKMGDGQEGSFASRIHVNQKEMKVTLDACLGKMEAVCSGA
jgi:hypothetical protein